MQSNIYMPILNYNLLVPMSALNEEWAQRNHQQSLSRLAERGGLSLCEAAAIAERRHWVKMTDADAIAAFNTKKWA